MAGRSFARRLSQPDVRGALPAARARAAAHRLAHPRRLEGARAGRDQEDAARRLGVTRRGEPQAQEPLGLAGRSARPLSAQARVRALGPAGAAGLRGPRDPGGRRRMRAGLRPRHRDGDLQHAAGQHRPPAAQVPAQMPGRLHRRHRVGRDEAGGHGDDSAHRAGPHRHAGRQPPVPDGEAPRDRRRDRGQPPVARGLAGQAFGTSCEPNTSFTGFVSGST
jgi:hypothetical protein